MQNYVWTLEVPKVTGYNTAVIGGGPAGVAAAISAARNGAKTILIESLGALGGLSTNGLVSILDTTCDGTRTITGGVMLEILDAMFERGLFEPIYRRERFVTQIGQYTPFDGEGMKRLLDDLCEAYGVEVSFFTTLVDAAVSHSNGRTVVDGILIHTVEGLKMLKAYTYIDTTGEGTLSALCGMDFEAPMTEECPSAMGATLCAEFSGINWEGQETRDGRFVLQGEAIRAGQKDGMFTYNEKMVPGLARNGFVTANVNAGHLFDQNPLSAKCMSEGMKLGRKIVWEYANCFRKYLSGCENLKVSATGTLLGIRESRRIIGEYVLTIDDFMARRKFPDQIGIYSKSVDIHPYSASKEEYERFKKENTETLKYEVGDTYGIPYGVIVPKGAENLWVAGRCASCDRKMHGSLRVQPVAYVMGQAAGTAAAIASRKNCTSMEVDVSLLRETLASQNAIVD